MKKIPVPCPQCTRRIFDVEPGVEVLTQVMTATSHKKKPQWKPDFYIKCWKCQCTVGYRAKNH